MKNIFTILQLLIISIALLIPLSGCKSNNTFEITGIWEFIQNQDDEASEQNKTVILEGSTNIGTVEQYPEKDDYWRGTYSVVQNQVIIVISYCRGIACIVAKYTGSIIYEKLISGLYTGSASIGGEVYHTWSGTWQLHKE